jgi:outer membrane lipoprotein carrier protein
MIIKNSFRYSTLGLAVASLVACGSGTAETDTSEQTRAAELPASQVATGQPQDAALAPIANESSSLPAAEAGGSSAAPPADPAPAGPAANPTAGAGAPAAVQPAPAGAQASEARQILERVERAYADVRSLEADFIQDLRVPLLSSDQQSRGKLFQRQPNRLLMRFTDPAGDVVVADGQHLWMYYPSVDRVQVMRTSLAQNGVSLDFQREFIHNANERYSSTLAGEETVDGRATHVLDLSPRTASPYRSVRIWVDKATHIVRRFEIAEQNDTVRRIELRNIRRNVTLDDALFRFTVPEGAQVFDQ